MTMYSRDGNVYDLYSDMSYKNRVDQVMKIIASIQVPESDAEKFRLLKSLSQIQQAIDEMAEKVIDEEE